MSTQVTEDNEGLAPTKDRQGLPQRKLARAHYLILSQMAANPANTLRKLPGGFWVVDPDMEIYREGNWYASTNAVSAMLRHGLLGPLRDNTVELTAVGIEALRTGLYTPLGAK